MSLAIKRNYGWRRELPDQRDIPFIHTQSAIQLPSKISLRADMPPIYDQGQLGSCTANALARNSLPPTEPAYMVYRNSDISIWS